MANAEITKSQDLLEALVDDEIVVLSQEDGKFYSLRDTGRRVWELLEAPCSFEHIIFSMLQEYDVSPDECESQIEQLVLQLEGRSLVKLSSGCDREEVSLGHGAQDL
ncbi:MAG: PqqD family peptide modification chaperone [Pseudomonadota bacterium]